MNEADGKPPVFRTWRGWYWLVMAVMLVQVFLYLWMTNHFQ